MFDESLKKDLTSENTEGTKSQNLTFNDQFFEDFYENNFLSTSR